MKPHDKKKFATLRAWNRQRNYFMKALRMRMAKWALDLPIRKPFDLQTINTVLLLRNDGKIGDMIVSTSLIRELKTHGYTVDILATPENVVAITHNPHIRKIHLDNLPDITTVLAAENYDLVIDMGDKISPESFLFLKKIKAKNVIGFNKGEYKLYNKTINFSGHSEHITTRYALLMETLELKKFTTLYDLHYPAEVDIRVSHFLSSLPKKNNIIINPFAADKKRELSLQQIQGLFAELHEKYPQCNIIYLDHNNILDNKVPDYVYKNPDRTLFGAFALIAHSDLIISPDTSIVHVAAAYQKPLIALYGNEMHGKYSNNSVWGPGYSKALQLMTKDKYHPIATIDVSEIIHAVQKIYAQE